MTSPDPSAERDSSGFRAVRPAGTGSSVPRPWGSSPLDALPLGLTSFVGREREIVEIRRLLSERRLLTLCGPGGRSLLFAWVDARLMQSSIKAARVAFIGGDQCSCAASL